MGSFRRSRMRRRNTLKKPLAFWTRSLHPLPKKNSLLCVPSWWTETSNIASQRLIDLVTLFTTTVTNHVSPLSHRGRGEESFCPFAGDTANGQVARPPLAEVDRRHHLAPLHHKGLQCSYLPIQILSPQAESHLSFAGIPACRLAGISCQSKDFNLSVFSLPLS